MQRQILYSQASSDYEQQDISVYNLANPVPCHRQWDGGDVPLLPHHDKPIKFSNGRKNLVVASQKGMILSPRTIIAQDHPMVKWMNEHESVISKQALETDHRFRSMWGQEIDVMNKVEAELFIPLKALGNLVGLISRGPKLSEQPAYSFQQ